MNIEVFSNFDIHDDAIRDIEEAVRKQPLYFNESSETKTPLYWFFDFEFDGYWVECFDYSQRDDTLCVRANSKEYMVREGDWYL